MGVYSSARILFSSFYQEPIRKGSWDSIVKIVARYSLDSPRFGLQYKQIFLLHICPDWLWGQPSLLFKG